MLLAVFHIGMIRTFWLMVNGHTMGSRKFEASMAVSAWGIPGLIMMLLRGGFVVILLAAGAFVSRFVMTDL